MFQQPQQYTSPKSRSRQSPLAAFTTTKVSETKAKERRPIMTGPTVDMSSDIYKIYI